MDYLRLFFILCAVKYSHSQYQRIEPMTLNKESKSKCNSSNNSFLVEQFFNLIFTEFHINPPICVCVQMCAEHPTYCYPNGCLRKEPNKKLDLPTMARINENTKPVFFVDDNIDFMNEYMEKNYIGVTTETTSTTQKPDTNMPLNLKPDAFKDRYKLLFNKNKNKMPKVELKYNLGEQVKNTKSDVLKNENLDLSKTRWPSNKLSLFNGQRAHADTQGKSNFFMSMLLDKDVANYPPKYFKRDLADTSNGTEVFDNKTMFVLEKSSLENPNFSLESILDGLIGGSFESNKTINNSNLINAVKQNERDVSDETIEMTTETIQIMDKENMTSEENLTTEQIPKKETMDIVSLNLTNVKDVKNKLNKNNSERNHSVVYNKKIAALSKMIDIQNNTSLEMIKRMTNNYVFDATTTTKFSSTSTTSTVTPEIVEEAITEANTTTTAVTAANNPRISTDHDMRSTKSSRVKRRQRLNKRLQSIKLD